MCSNESPDMIDATAENICNYFVKMYYGVILAKVPNEMYRFYDPKSIFCHAKGNEAQGYITGIDNIKEKLGNLNLSKATVDLDHGSVDAQPLENGGVVIMVTGIVSWRKNFTRQFCQTFVLSPASEEDKHHFYVLNDIFRLLDTIPPNYEPNREENSEEKVNSKVENLDQNVSETPQTLENSFTNKTEAKTDRNQPVLEEKSGLKHGSKNPSSHDSNKEVSWAHDVQQSQYEQLRDGNDKSTNQNGADIQPKSGGKPKSNNSKNYKKTSQTPSWASVVYKGSPKSGESAGENPENSEMMANGQSDTNLETQGGENDPLNEKNKQEQNAKVLFVRNVIFSATLTQLTEVFEQFGHVAEVKSHAQKGYAFIHFESAESAVAALDAAKEGQELEIEGRKLRIAPNKDFSARNHFRGRGRYYPRKKGGRFSGRQYNFPRYNQGYNRPRGEANKDGQNQTEPEAKEGSA